MEQSQRPVEAEVLDKRLVRRALADSWKMDSAEPIPALVVLMTALLAGTHISIIDNTE